MPEALLWAYEESLRVDTACPVSNRKIIRDAKKQESRTHILGKQQKETVSVGRL